MNRKELIGFISRLTFRRRSASVVSLDRHQETQDAEPAKLALITRQHMLTMKNLAIALFSIILASQVMAATKPNIVFIFADDWGWGDLSCHGHPYVKTPNIDRLAAEGTDFHRFTVASGVCSPSRTAVMTGHFPARYNIDGHFAWVPSNAKRNMPDWLNPEAPLLPRMLQKGGYATAHFGKWHLANNMIPDSPLPSEYGYDAYGAFNCAGEQMPVHEDARNAIAFIEKSHDEGKPFFINLWIHEPHTPFHTVPKYRWRFRELDEADNIYASVLSHADDRIGEVLDTLDRLDLARNTLVIFSSDNGPARAVRPTKLTLQHDTATGAGYGIGASKGITGGRKGYKSALFEGGIGVPFIARWPGQIAAGKIDNHSLISAVDLLPTFCEVAGVQLPDSYQPDGLSQTAALMGKGTTKREKPLFWKMQSPWPIQKTRPFHWVSYAIVDQNWKLVTNQDFTYTELYDIVADPYEKTDLKEVKPAVVNQLLEKLTQWKATLPDKPTGKVFSAERSVK
jgi:N-acetylgalactosamine-6-sulfatase